MFAIEKLLDKYSNDLLCKNLSIVQDSVMERNYLFQAAEEE